jgi:hypothetical protein
MLCKGYLGGVSAPDTGGLQANRRHERRERRGTPMISIHSSSTTLSVTAGLWAAAVGSAIMLTYELNRPLHEAGAAAHGITPLVAALLAAGWMGLAGALAGAPWRRRRHVLAPVQAKYL